MRDDLRSNPDQFLVNLILMSVQFLKSHDRYFVVGVEVNDVWYYGQFAPVEIEYIVPTLGE